MLLVFTLEDKKKTKPAHTLFFRVSGGLQIMEYGRGYTWIGKQTRKQTGKQLHF